MFRFVMSTLGLAAALALPAFAQDSTKQDKNFDVRSSVGDLHIGSDADARKIGLPLYPGARPRTDDKDNTPANLSLFTEAFGFKLVVAHYDSDDAPAKVIDYYRDKLKKYGKVIECHSTKQASNVEVHDDDKDSKGGKQLKCDENSGPITELKVGTEDNQHAVSIEPLDAGKGSTFSMVYVRAREKQGEI